MRQSWFIASHDIRNMLRERETLFWLFLMPIMFFYFIGNVTGGFGGGSGPTKDKVAIRRPASAGFHAHLVVKRLEDQDYEVVEPETVEGFDGYSRRLRFPENFTESALAGEQSMLGFGRENDGIGGDYDSFRIGRAVYTVLADLIASTEAGIAPSPEAFADLDTHPRALSLRVAPAGERKKIPSGFDQTIPGITVMFTLIAMLTSGASLIVIERNQGLLRRLASTPIPRSGVVLGKWAGRMALGLIQAGYAMLVGTLMFGMDWGPDVAMVFAIVVAWAAVCASLGLLLGSIASTEGQAVGVGVLAANVLAALGGCWWPIEVAPAWMQRIANFLPTGWTMDALHRLISFRTGAASALPHLAALLIAAGVFGWFAGRRFRFH